MPTPPGSTVRGAYHIHTRRSDGGGSVDDVARAAADAGLQFAILTDHGDGTRPPLPPSYRAGVLVLDGVEVSTTGGHYTVLGLDAAAPYRLAGEPRDVIADVKRFGGFGFAAHPDSPKPALAWQDLSLPIDGLEWLNLDNEWRTLSAWRLSRGLAHYFVRPASTVGSLVGHAGGMLARWADLARTRRIVGLLASDAHARIASGDEYAGGVGVPVPSYEAAFRSARVYLELPAPLTGRAEADAGRVLAAIRDGRVYGSIDAWAVPGSVTFVVSRGGHDARMGAFLPGDGPVRVRAAVDAPAGARLRLLCDGRVAADSAGHGDGAPVLDVELPVAATPRSCQIAAGWMRDGVFAHWLVTNPVYLRASDPEVAEPAAPAATASRGAGGDAGAWTVEHDAGSSARVSGIEGGIEFAYALRGGPRAGQYAAFVLPATAGVGDGTRLRARLSSDRPMRVSVQLREPSGGRDGRRWQRSVAVGPVAQTIVVPFDDFVAIDPGPPHPPLDRVHALLFVVDTVHAPPGLAGRVVLHELAFER